MNWPAQCAVVIPCFNEGKQIGAVVRAVRKHLPAVFVVDDCSSDDTAQQAKAAGAEVLRHSTNLGKGAALMTGWRHAQQQGFEWALTMDGDGQHASNDIPAFLQHAEKTNSALVIGNRMENPFSMPFVRRLVNRWMSKRISLRAGRTLPDTQCGFRLMKLSAWHALRIETQRFEIESEVLLAFVRAGLPVSFVPIQVIYGNEQSKIHPLADTVRWLRWWWTCDTERTFSATTANKTSTTPHPALSPEGRGWPKDG